jgi:release factor glutamine methyltransferase
MVNLRLAPQNTLAENLQLVERCFSENGVALPTVEAQQICAHLLALRKPTDLLFHLQTKLALQQLERLAQMVGERISGKPLQLILGSVGFYSATLSVGEGIFIPRPETETLVEVGLKFLRGRAETEVCPYNNHNRILDLCTGCGAVLIALAMETGWEGVGTDICRKALAFAEDNARKNRVEQLLDFCRGDLFSALSEPRQKFALIVANPPYIPTEQLEALPAEVRNYDPWEALDGGKDGLAVIRRIVAEAPEYLVSGGMLALEIGEEQGGAVNRLYQQVGLSEVRISKDLAGRDRVVSGLWVR